MAELYEPGRNAEPAFFVVMLDERDEVERARRILAAGVLQINDRVAGLYAGQAAPENVSELEKPNYG